MRKDLYTNGSVDLPKINKQRSFFDLTHSSHIDMCSGILYPIDQVIEICPGDTFDYSHALNIRMTNPPKTPTSDTLVFDLYWFYVPHRIVWKNFDKFITNQGPSFYVDANYSYPVMDLQNPNLSGTSYPALNNSALDYLGYGLLNLKGSAIGGAANPSYLPLRGYCKIWNEYFRYESLQTEVLIDEDDTPFSYSNFLNPSAQLSTSTASNYYEAALDPALCWSDLITKKCYANVLLPVNRLPGYFSRALPQPLAGSDVKILEDISINNPYVLNSSGQPASNGNLTVYGSDGDISIDSGLEFLGSINGNLGASSSNTIRSLSNAFALNKFLYIDNVYGKRITEWTYGHFEVNVPDSRVQRPEFLAKRRVYININQIIQSSATETSSPQGNAGAWSQTYDKAHDFVKSFVEFGYLFSLGCIRVLNHSFSQGIDKHWAYRSRFDFMLPEFNNVGDQEVKLYEIYPEVISGLSNFDATFGYQERYAHLKMIPSRVAGYMRPQHPQTLAVYTYTDYYASRPYLSAQWMFEPHENVDRTLYINQLTAPAFILDYVADIKSYRTIPYHSIPGGLTGSY